VQTSKARLHGFGQPVNFVTGGKDLVIKVIRLALLVRPLS
jgi:hypothetical protein